MIGYKEEECWKLCNCDEENLKNSENGRFVDIKEGIKPLDMLQVNMSTTLIAGQSDESGEPFCNLYSVRHPPQVNKLPIQCKAMYVYTCIESKNLTAKTLRRAEMNSKIFQMHGTQSVYFIGKNNSIVGLDTESLKEKDTIKLKLKDKDSLQEIKIDRDTIYAISFKGVVCYEITTKLQSPIIAISDIDSVEYVTTLEVTEKYVFTSSYLKDDLQIENKISMFDKNLNLIQENSLAAKAGEYIRYIRSVIVRERLYLCLFDWSSCPGMTILRVEESGEIA